MIVAKRERAGALSVSADQQQVVPAIPVQITGRRAPGHVNLLIHRHQPSPVETRGAVTHLQAQRRGRLLEQRFTGEPGTQLPTVRVLLAARHPRRQAIATAHAGIGEGVEKGQQRIDPGCRKAKRLEQLRRIARRSPQRGPRVRLPVLPARAVGELFEARWIVAVDRGDGVEMMPHHLAQVVIGAVVAIRCSDGHIEE